MDNTSPIIPLPSGASVDGQHHPLGISVIDFKLSLPGNNDLFIIENTFHAPGGPARHLHYRQDEWFYAMEGEFLFEIGSRQFRLTPGDSILGPRQIPHVWAFTGSAARGRILVVFTPAGQMEDFFRKVAAANAMPAQDAALWRAHGMELLGPPLQV